MISKLFRRISPSGLDLTGPGSVAIASVAYTLILLSSRLFGGLQPLELMAYDWMLRQKIDEGPDRRLLVVGINEEDIQTLNQSTLSDRLVAQMLEKLSKLKPSAIGLDVYRDLPQGEGIKELEAQLQKPNIIAIAKMGDAGTGKLEVPPPPSLPPDSLGFNDLVNDPDGAIRRSLLFGNLTEDITLYSFSLQLALKYLMARGIEPINNESKPEEIRLGKAVFMPLVANSGAYQKIDAKGYQMLLNYRSPRNVARQVSLTQVLQDKVEPDWVKDKIVLIGYTAASKKDLFLTPYSAAEEKNPRMPGVLVHAHITSQILSAVAGDRPLFWFWPEWAEVLWIATWSLVGGSLAWRSRHPLILAASATAMLCILVGGGFYIFTLGGWVPIATPAIASILTGASIVAYRAYQAQQQQQIVMKLLGQNTSPEIADALWKSRRSLLNEGKLAGEKLIATMMFTDLKDFSTISEQMPPELLMDWLNEYLAVLTQEVQTHHGIINKFTGDGIMAAFGVPVARSTSDAIALDAYHAVSCGLAFGTRLQAINQDWKKRGLPVVQMRVGIFTGPVVAGSLGGKDRMEYGIIGDSVNIASRLESCEKDRQAGICRVLIAKETLVLLEDRFLVEHWGPLALKGKHQTVDVYRAIAHRGKQEAELEDSED